MTGMTQVGMHEAKTKLSELVKRAEQGEEIVIARNGEPTVRLVPVEKRNRFAELYGVYKGQIRMSDDFDEFDDELADMFGIPRE